MLPASQALLKYFEGDFTDLDIMDGDVELKNLHVKLESLQVQPSLNAWICIRVWRIRKALSRPA